MIRILLADDQTLIRAGFRALLSAEPDMEAVAECGTGRDAVRLAAREHPDVVLMDIRMPDMDGLEATRKIMADQGMAGTRIIILTTFELDEYIAEAVRAGAAGFLVKDTEPEELLRAVRVVNDGDALLSPTVTRRIMAQLGAAVPGSGGAGVAGAHHRTRARSPAAGGRGLEQRGDRGAAGDHPAHSQDPRLPHHDQASGAGPGAAGGTRLRIGARTAGLGRLR